MKPTISICIPHHNGRDTIERCIQSVLSSNAYDPKRVEVVVADDCSTDDSISILERYQRESNIRLIKNQERLGLTENWNKTLSSGNGDIITLLHQDDWYDPQCLADVVGIFKSRDDLAFAALGQVFYNEDATFRQNLVREDLGYFTGKEYFIKCLNFHDIPAPSTAFFSRRHLSSLSIYYHSDFLFCSEFDLYLRLAQAHPNAYFFHDPRLLIKRGHGKNRFSERYPGYRSLDFCKIIEKYVPLIENINVHGSCAINARAQILRDLESIIDLNDILQLKKVLENASFRKWLGCDSCNPEAVLNLFNEKGHRMAVESNIPKKDGMDIPESPKAEKHPSLKLSGTEPFFKPIFITGFYNTGTRLLAKLLQQMGVFQVVNQQTFEWGYIQDLNSSILPEWNDPEAVRQFDSHRGSFQISPLEIAEMLKEYGYNNDQPWGHKDPRTCATLGAWLEAFPEAKVVHIVRDPVDVLGTLTAEYDKFTPAGKLPQKALSFWGDLQMAYSDRILQAADKAKKFVEIKFEDLCLHSHQVLLNLAHTLNLSEGKTVDLESIQPGKIGIHRQWILQGKLEVLAVDRLKDQLKEYRSKYGYGETAGSRVTGDPSRESCFDRILTSVF